eukprot:GFUD01033062.1.p1 GENE.GFUD01033062.1~~GFUD01033062.1.p1  ORF type:complete len:388 (-),score=54.54 GFUD01033062.1:292-1455(-)
MGHAIKHGKRKNIIFPTEEKNITLEELTSDFDKFPSYRAIFQQTHLTLLSGNGPLPEASRHFIARMACNATGCETLTKMEEQCFLKSGGNANWLTDLSSVPEKLRRLDSLNLLMTRSSSFINYTHIKSLTEGEDSWTLAEIVQALVILVHFHGLTSFPIVFNKFKATEKNEFVEKSKEEPKLRKFSENRDSFDESDITISSKRFEQELKRKRSFSEAEVVTKSQSTQKILKPVLSKDLCDTNDHELNYRNTSTAIRIQDYCWDDQGFSVLSTFYSDIAVLMDDKFRTARKLTQNNEENHNANETFRTAVWNYVQCIFGVHHDDYNYKEIDQELNENLKDFIKLSCSNCSKLVSEQNSERAFVSILVMEARLQSELLFVLRAVMKHMS